MKIKSSKWLGIAVLLAASGLGLRFSAESKVLSAELGYGYSALSTQHSALTEVRRESVPPSNGPAPLTGLASRFNPLLRSPLDIPVFGDNYRANTDPQSPSSMPYLWPS